MAAVLVGIGLRMVHEDSEQGEQEDQMLTVAYCRVSTEEQADEGFSIDGQADKLRVYAELHDFGEVVVVTDPGLSGKDMADPGSNSS